MLCPQPCSPANPPKSVEKYRHRQISSCPRCLAVFFTRGCHGQKKCVIFSLQRNLVLGASLIPITFRAAHQDWQCSLERVECGSNPRSTSLGMCESCRIERVNCSAEINTVKNDSSVRPVPSNSRACRNHQPRTIPHSSFLQPQSWRHARPLFHRHCFKP
jgi:hypothetical protein